MQPLCVRVFHVPNTDKRPIYTHHVVSTATTPTTQNGYVGSPVNNSMSVTAIVIPHAASVRQVPRSCNMALHTFPLSACGGNYGCRSRQKRTVAMSILARMPYGVMALVSLSGSSSRSQSSTTALLSSSVAKTMLRRVVSTPP